MKRILSILLTAALLCGILPMAAAAAGKPAFKRERYKVRYLSSTQLTYDTNGSSPVYFRCEENNLGISVDKNGRVKSDFCLRKYGFVQVEIYNGSEVYDTCTVKVDADMWQWMIILFLLGWFWY